MGFEPDPARAIHTGPSTTRAPLSSTLGGARGGNNGKIRILRSHDPDAETRELLFDVLLAGEGQLVEVAPHDFQGSDLPIVEVPPDYSPREYNGIARYESGGLTRIWVSYAGAISDPGIPDTTGYRDLIFGQQIILAESP